MSTSRQVCQTSDPDVRFICCVCYQVKWLEIVPENDRKYTGVLPRAVELFIPQHIRVPADANLFDLTDNNYNNKYS